MAVIGAIRKRTGLLIGFIAVALLLFLMMDALSSNSLVSGSGGGQNVGKIEGKKVDIQSYEKSVNNYQQRVEVLFPQAEINSVNQAQFRDEVWDNFAMEALLGKDLQNMGLDVTADELGSSMWGENPHYFAQNVLVNPQTGQYDRNFARQYVISADQDENARLKVRHLEQLIEEDRLKTKYASLFNKGIYVPDFMAKDEKGNSQRSADVSYVFLPYADVDESEIRFTDKDLEAYIKTNAYKFKQDESREVKYYSIDIVPSVEDTADGLAAITTLLEEFKTTDNDSIFVKRYSDAVYTARYFKEDELTGDPNAAALFSDEEGSYYGPYFYNGAFNIAKLIKRKMIPDSVSARHILLVPKSYSEVDSLRVLADSLEILITDNRASFAELAAIHSQDQSNSQDGGDLGFFTPGQMVPTFNDAVFYHYGEGAVLQVTSRFGIHIVKIDESTPATPAVQVAIVNQELGYSKDTERELFRASNEWRQQHDTQADFEAADGVDLINTVRVTKNQVSVVGLSDARKMVQWAFKEKVGTINNFDIEDKYIIALISGESAEGTGSLEDLRVQVEDAVKREKKAELLAGKVAALNASNIQEVASGLGAEVKSNQALSFSAVSLEGSGNDSKAVSGVFGTKQGSLSPALEGANGVYIVQVNGITEPSNVDDFYAEKARLKPNVSFQAILSDLKKDANIEDTRFQYY
ncbi:MAG: hypothetical protein GY751_06655 [Bacteroidetes bacterium]|nr:hypothetical protein [Bacteroidota bacterium]